MCGGARVCVDMTRTNMRDEMGVAMRMPKATGAVKQPQASLPLPWRFSSVMTKMSLCSPACRSHRSMRRRHGFSAHAHRRAQRHACRHALMSGVLCSRCADRHVCGHGCSHAYGRRDRMRRRSLSAYRNFCRLHCLRTVATKSVLAVRRAGPQRLTACMDVSLGGFRFTRVQTCIRQVYRHVSIRTACS